MGKRKTRPGVFVASYCPSGTISGTTPLVPTARASDPGLLSLGAGCTLLLPDLTDGVVATDNCGSVMVTQVPTSGTLIGVDTLVTFTATDGAGNMENCMLIVTVKECVEGEGEGEGEFTLAYSGSNPVPAHVRDTDEIFVIDHNGLEPITYQWYRFTEGKAFEPVSGQTETSLVFETVFEMDAGDYMCTADDVENKMAQSPVITLSVLAGVPVYGPVALTMLALFLMAGGVVEIHGLMRRRYTSF